MEIITMDLEEFRKFVEAEGFHCVEVHDNAQDNITFNFEVEGDEETVCVTYDKKNINGIYSFAKANIVIGRFNFYCAYVESMLINGQCSYIKHYRGERVVDFSRFNK